MYRTLYSADRDDFQELYGGDIVSALDFYYKKGRVELATSGATHAFLPIFRDCREAVTSQVETAIIAHRKIFGKHPAGFWLPQMGWYPGLGEVLRSYNVQYTVVTTKGAMLGEPTPRYGSFAPVECPSGLVAFIRDAGATKAVWSESTGYPADPVYRDFYRDIGFDLPADYVKAYLQDTDERIFTGFKYWAVTGRTEGKASLLPRGRRGQGDPTRRDLPRRAQGLGLGRFRPHGQAPAHGLSLRRGTLRPLVVRRPGFSRGPVPPGRLRRRACRFDPRRLSQGLPRSPEVVTGILVMGRRRLRRGLARRLQRLDLQARGQGDRAHVGARGTLSRRIGPAGADPRSSGARSPPRHVLGLGPPHAAGKSAGFARRQIEEPIANFGRIYDMLCSNTVSTEWLTRLEKRNNLFPSINYRMFRRKR